MHHDDDATQGCLEAGALGRAVSARLVRPHSPLPSCRRSPEATAELVQVSLAVFMQPAIFGTCSFVPDLRAVATERGGAFDRRRACATVPAKSGGRAVRRVRWNGENMQEHARVVVVGGGIAGASVLYHLAERGWTDAVLLEMNELTSGSTWHAAGNVPTFSGNRNVIRLQKYSTELYARLAADPDYPIAYHQSGSIRLAQTRARLQEFRHVAAMANSLGLEYELMTPAEMKRRHPQVEDHGLQGALWDPADGDIDPSQLTQALASAARRAGASVRRFTRVTGLERATSGEWTVSFEGATDGPSAGSTGTITAEYVVNAGGYRSAEITGLAGMYLPLVSLEHQYLVTESVPELEALDGKLPLVRDPDDSYYLRQEKTGLILGPYERRATARWEDGRVPEHFAYELYADDLERLEWYIEQACARVPLLGTVGVQRVINGPIPYSPDGNPYVGPAWGLPNVFHCCGFSFGVCQGGGAGKSLAEWIVDGRPEWDLWSLDPRRYGAYADQGYVVARAKEVYRNEYAIHFPVEEWPEGRPALSSPVYERLAAKGARFGARGGWERATWFPRSDDTSNGKNGAEKVVANGTTNGAANGGTDDVPFDEPLDGTRLAEDGDILPMAGAGYERGEWFRAVGEECRHVRDHAGILDMGGFTKLVVAGKGAADWLDTMIAGRLPRPGRLSLACLCHPSGGVWSDVTVTRLDEERFLLISGAPAHRHDRQWLEEHLPADAAFTLEDVSERFGTLVLAGPASRAVLGELTDGDPGVGRGGTTSGEGEGDVLSNAAFPWLSVREITLAGIEVLALRVNYLGELGWELHVKVDDQLALYDALMAAGAAHALRDIGMYAMESMRLEKSYRAWKLDLDHTLSPFAAGLERFVDVDKPDGLHRQGGASDGAGAARRRRRRPLFRDARARRAGRGRGEAGALDRRRGAIERARDRCVLRLPDPHGRRRRRHGHLGRLRTPPRAGYRARLRRGAARRRRHRAARRSARRAARGARRSRVAVRSRERLSARLTSPSASTITGATWCGAFRYATVDLRPRPRSTRR